MLHLLILFPVYSLLAANFMPIQERHSLPVLVYGTNYTTQQEAIGDEANFSQSTFSTCRSSEFANGGAIYSLSQTKLYVLECTFDNCTTEQFGGAIYFRCAAVSKLNLDDSSFRFCTARSGGAVYALGMLSLKSNAFYQCNATSEGGHLYIESINYESKIKNTNFSHGTVSHDTNITYGGSIYIANAEHNLQISGCDFSANTADNGGAITFGSKRDRFGPTINVEFEYCNFSINTAKTTSRNQANDIYAYTGWQDVLTSSSFFQTESASFVPMLYIEGVGDRSNWLGGNINIPDLLWWIYVAIVAGVFLVVFLPAIICCCFCCGCACFAASQATRRETTYVVPTAAYQAQPQVLLYGQPQPQPQGSLYAPGIPQKY